MTAACHLASTREDTRNAWIIRTVLASVLVASLGLAMVELAASRVVFLAGAVIVSWLALRAGSERHLEVAILLFIVTPVTRRVIDLHCGFDPAGIVLAAPLLAISLTALELPSLLLNGRRANFDAAPFTLAACCIAYGFVISAISGHQFEGLIALLKWIAPPLYGLWIFERARFNPALPQTLARTFMFATPIIGAYGILQYLVLPDWDALWMIGTQLKAIGEPEPFKVRVFSTMNSPASFATFVVCGLLFSTFLGKGWRSIVWAMPGAVGLLLSLYRTGWMTFVAGVACCAAFGQTRTRAPIIGIAFAAIVAVVTVTPPFDDVISQRLETLNALPTDDGSGQERLQQFVDFYNQSDNFVVGQGLEYGLVNSSLVVDGALLIVPMCLGIGVGAIFLVAIIWLAGRAVARVRAGSDQLGIIAAAVTVGSIVQLPLASIHLGEQGFILWTFAAMAIASSPSRIIERRRLVMANGDDGAARHQRIG